MDSTSQTAVFHGGVDLAAGVGDAVVAIGEGTVAFAGEQPDYGLLVVVNHAQGLQTRYAHLGAIAVQPGQVIGKGDRLGQVGQTGTPSLAQPHLHFEVRLNSPLGWIAQDPQGYFSMPSQLPVADGSPAARAQRLVPY
ncbi:MAG: M23 family metallopeptidase [Synechococcales cyanobacterium RM1_1_8]|nr:M23 family metallopeptidase [Synechococcales cyanobacterium RM1_1_8]